MMNGLIIMNNLIVTKKGKFWEVKEDWEVLDYKVPKGFLSNGVNTVPLLYLLVRPAGDLFEAAIAHDHAYGSKSLSRLEADKLFYQIALKYNAPKWKAKGAYYGVRLFGKSRYGKRGYN